MGQTMAEEDTAQRWGDKTAEAGTGLEDILAEEKHCADWDGSYKTPSLVDIIAFSHFNISLFSVGIRFSISPIQATEM
jgi:hypothetical protein